MPQRKKKKKKKKADSTEKKKNVVLFSIDLPGVKLQNIQLRYEKAKLSVHAERKRGDTTILAINRSFVVNEKKVDTRALQAYLADGVLTVYASEKEATPTVHVPITTDEEILPGSTHPADTVTLAETASEKETSNK